MLIDNQLFRARVGICNTDLSFLEKMLIVSQNNKFFYITHAKVLSCLILVMVCLLVVNIYLSFLKINISSPIMLAKSFNPCIAPCNYIITIYISITSILTTQVLLKSGDIETNPGRKKIICHQVLPLELKRAGCSWLCKGIFNRGIHYYA